MCNHGIDGWDAKTTEFATAETWEEAYDYLKSKGYYVEHRGEVIPRTIACRNKMMYHFEESKRYTMGCITYEIRSQEISTIPSVASLKEKEKSSSIESNQSPTVMALCEIDKLILHTNQTYIFVKMPGCQLCADYENKAEK